MTSVVIWGAGGHGREVNFLCEQAGLDVVGFLDERPHMKGQVVDDLPVLGVPEDIVELREKVRVVCAGVGDPALKQRFAQVTSDAGFRFCDPIVHPGVRLSKRSTIGPGSVVCAGVTLTVNVHIGQHVIVNRNATLGHDVTLGDFVTISPGASISGNVTIDEGVFVGTNAAIREKLHIHAWSVIGGGAFVRGEVPSRTLYAGVPATLKRRLP